MVRRSWYGVFFAAGRVSACWLWCVLLVLIHIASTLSSVGKLHTAATRPIYAAPESYPRYVGTERGIPEYFPKDDGQTNFIPVGAIPQGNEFEAQFDILL